MPDTRKFYMCLGIAVILTTIVVDQWLRDRMSDLLPLLSGLKEIIVSAAAVTGAIVALRGLSAWKRQLSGKTEYEVALRFLRAAYRVRDAVGLVRSPFMSSGEMAQAVKDRERPEKGFSVTEATAAAYEQRWKSIAEGMSDLQVATHEAEALWGSEPIKLIEPLRKCIAELNWALGVHVGQPKVSKPEFDDKIFAIVFSAGNDAEQDPFGAKLRDAVTKIEEFTRPHLK